MIRGRGKIKQTSEDLLIGAKIAFGLVAQGHITSVEASIAEGCDWKEIGRRIGWDGETAEQYYSRYVASKANLKGN